MRRQTISALLNNGTANATYVYNLLSNDYHRLPRAEIAWTHPDDNLHHFWHANVQCLIECDGLEYRVRTEGVHRKKAKVLEVALRLTLQYIASQVSDSLEDLGHTQRGPHSLPQATAEPTCNQRRIIADASSHLHVLKSLAKKLSESQPVEIVVVDIEMHTVTRRLREVGLVVLTGNMHDGRSVCIEHYVVEEEVGIEGNLVSQPHSCAYGASQIMSKQAVLDIVGREFRDLGPDSILCGHSISNDKAWLEKEGLTLDGVTMADVMEIERAIRQSLVAISLERLAREVYQVDFRGVFHNAGNDCIATALVLLAQLQAVESCAPIVEWFAESLVKSRQ